MKNEERQTSKTARRRTMEKDHQSKNKDKKQNETTVLVLLFRLVQVLFNTRPQTRMESKEGLPFFGVHK